MSQTDTLAAFYLALKEAPGDPVTLQALADWYEEQGQSDNAACLRWTVRRRRFPFEYHPEGAGMVIECKNWKDGWFWWAVDDSMAWGHPATCFLPEKLWKRLKNHFPHTPSTFKHFPTLQAAYEALFDAWPRFAPAERERWS